MPILIGLLLTLTFTGCRQRQLETSTARQIFSDQQRFDADIRSYSGILQVESGCTAFVINRARQTAMTAKHCQPKAGDSLRIGSDGANVGGTRSQIKEILAESTDLSWDFVVFRYAQPIDGLINEEYKLATRDYTAELAGLPPGSFKIRMVGYPADSYRNGKLTESRCDVRFPTEEFIYGFRSRANSMLTAWDRDPRYARHPSYRQMRTTCEWNVNWMLESPEKIMAFRHDCSTYGGNSGGPIFVERGGQRVVIGFPYSYFPAQEFERGTCFGDFYEYFWTPFWGDEFKKYLKWDRADRASNKKADFPVALPMHLIVKQHRFFADHPEYLDGP